MELKVKNTSSGGNEAGALPPGLSVEDYVLETRWELRMKVESRITCRAYAIRVVKGPPSKPWNLDIHVCSKQPEYELMVMKYSGV